MRFITTAEWGANPSKEATRDSHPIGSTRGVTLHWTGPGFGWPWPHSRCFRLVRSIERHHEYGNGWGDIAYNLLPCPHGYVFEGRGVGVRSAANGYFEVNDDWYAVCYLGGVGDRFTAAGRAAMVDAVQLLREKGNAGPRVNGHRDHKGTDCPGETIYDWLNHMSFDKEDELMISDEDAEKIARHVWAFVLGEYDENTNPEQQRARVLLSQAHNRAGDARRYARDAAKKLEENS